MRVRRVMTVGFTGLAGVVGAASVAFGCASVTSPYLEGLQPNSEAVPAMVVVKGGNWVGGQNLDLVWVPTGQRIGSVTPAGNGAFSARVEIPASAERGADYVDYVRAVQGAKTANTLFGVDSPAEQGSPSVPKVEPVTSASTSGGTPRSSTTPTDQAQPTSQPQTGGSGGIPARPADSTVDAGSTAPAATNADGSVSAPARSASAPAAAAPVRERSTGPAAAGTSASPLTPPAPARTESTSGTAAEAAAQAVARGSLGDLWTGLEGAPAAPGQSLLNLPADTQSTSPAAAVGGVLAISLVALGAGFGITEARRRRALAQVEG